MCYHHSHLLNSTSGRIKTNSHLICSSSLDIMQAINQNKSQHIYNVYANNSKHSMLCYLKDDENYENSWCVCVYGWGKAETGFIKWQAGLLISKRQSQWSDAEHCRQILLKPDIFWAEISLWASLCHALCAHNANVDWSHCRFASHRRLVDHFVNRWGCGSGQVMLGLSLLYVCCKWGNR